MKMLKQQRHLIARIAEESSDHDRFCDLVVLNVPRQLKTLSGSRRETIEVQAVVPIRVADERQTVRTPVFQRIQERTMKMVEQCSLRIGNVGIDCPFVQDRLIAGLFYVCHDRQDEPQRIVIEPTADIGISLLRERLILMVTCSI